VSSGSGISRSHRFSSAASCTGFSSHRLTPAGSRSSDSATSCNRRIFPFFRKIPSTAMSATVSVFVFLRIAAGPTHLTHGRNDVLDELWHAQLVARDALRTIASRPIHQYLERHAKYA
jgi:hypothetical protein